ncbi:MAG: hypothetical protein J0J01_11735 [Reyranella sp.]|uniref:hypothetical protein n=1 Tax=Reyranella sp. TaxID=1929291 RepID=UPI001AD2720F|nr:hypothetical protein [Reyranella sp.]MBN9087571.1 hypothetical protein [Reyranella sp.]
MEAFDDRRTRLRHELQEAYDTWLRISESCATRESIADALDVSGCPESAQLEWFEYLAAKQRLILAYAERQANDVR